MKEIWKPIPGFERYYFVSTLGNFKSIGGRKGGAKTDKLLKLKLMRDGYLYARLNGNDGQTYGSAHRIVAKVFIPNPKSKKEVNHKNLVKNDNRMENLEWVTSLENMQHAILLHGEWRKGGSRGASKYNIPNYTPGMTTTKEGKAEYMKHYNRIRCQKS